MKCHVMILFLALATLACAGCTDSRSRPEEPIAGLSGDLVLADLTEDEVQRICEWRQALRGEDLLDYQCIGEGYIGSEMSGAAVTYLWTADHCVATMAATRSRYPDCGIQLATWAQCERDRAELVCWFATPETPSCEVDC